MAKLRPDPVWAVSIDAHVIEGRPQGSRTVLTNLLKALGALELRGQVTIYCTNPDLCRERIGNSDFEYVRIAPSGSLRRLAEILPRALWKNRSRVNYWQYIVSPFAPGANIVAIHDILPLTHPHLFPMAFRLRCQILFFLSMLKARAILVVSNNAKSEISRIFPRFADKLFLSRNGPSFAKYIYFSDNVLTKSYTPRARRYVLNVGRIEPRKNIGLLVQAFQRADIDGVDLLIAGTRDLGDKEVFLSNTNVRFLGSVDDNELIDLYKNASLFVFPSRAEGFGIPLLDAVLFGIPTICSNQTALPETSGGLATMFNPVAVDAVEVLSNLIRGHFGGEPIATPSLNQRLAHAEEFGWEEAARRFAEVVNGVIRI